MRDNFYTLFNPRTVDRDDLDMHCKDMLHELEKGRLDECTCGFIGHGPCDVPDFEEENAEFEEDVEDVRTEAFQKCVDARVAIRANEVGMAYMYHECGDLFRTWRDMYGRVSLK